MPNVSAARFSAKTDRERKLYAIDWRNAIGTDAIASAKWESHPNGLGFADDTVSGTVTQVRITGGVPGVPYRVRCLVTLAGTGEVLEALGGDNQPGVPLEVLAFPVTVPAAEGWRNDYGRGAVRTSWR